MPTAATEVTRRTYGGSTYRIVRGAFRWHLLADGEPIGAYESETQARAALTAVAPEGE